MQGDITDDWLRLDNGAKIYPSIISRRMTSVFRLSVYFREEVDRKRLQAAVDHTLIRFPYYQVTLRSGFFWEYLQRVDRTVVVQKEVNYPCRRFHGKSDKGLFLRALYFKKKLSLEFSHILTDGTGALSFLMALLSHYLEIEIGNEYIDHKAAPSAEEMEDSYRRYFKAHIPRARHRTKAYHHPYRLADAGVYYVTTCTCESSAVLAKAKSFQVSLTEYLTAHYFMSIAKAIEIHGLKKNRPIRLMIPVNLRKLFPSKTMRNFFLPVIPEMDLRLGDYSFEELVRSVHYYLRMEITPKRISKLIARNVSGELNILFRLIPILIKQLLMGPIYSVTGSSQHSGILSNLGAIRLPDRAYDAIERLEFLLNPNPATILNLGVISIGNVLSLSIGSLTENRAIERLFFGGLRQDGIRLKLYTNY